MAKTKEPAAPPPRARSDAYTGMLAISFLALVGGCVLLYLDYAQYPEKAPPALPPFDMPGIIGKTTTPAGKAGPVAPQDPPQAQDPDMKKDEKKDDKKDDKKGMLPREDVPGLITLQDAMSKVMEPTVPEQIIPVAGVAPADQQAGGIYKPLPTGGVVGGVQYETGTASVKDTNPPASLPPPTPAPVVPASNTEPFVPSIPLPDLPTTPPTTPSDPPASPRFVPPM